MLEQDFRFRIQNSGPSRMNVYLEPWGESYELKPGKLLQVDVRGPSGKAPNDALLIRTGENGMTLWGWTGSGVTVTRL
jgi:hypothetical protein